MAPFIWLVVVGLLLILIVLMLFGTRPKSHAQLRFSLKMPRITPELLEQMLRIEPSIETTLRSSPCLYYPCKVRLKSGEIVDKVILSQEYPWIKLWGVYPAADRGKREVLITEVDEILSTESRLPARFATERYALGENSMGGTFFTIVFDDGSTLATVGGNVIDIVDYPEGKGPANVVEVLPFAKGPHPVLRPSHYWCLFNR
jgi:hypothetical protein